MFLKDRVRIARRFLRSVRIDTDLMNDSALEGFHLSKIFCRCTDDYGAPCL